MNNDITEKSKILIVDDSPIDISFIVNSLQSFFTIHVVTDGSKAIEFLASGNHPDLILMDVNMPAMSGFEACKKLKENESTHDIDVIFISAHDEISEKIKGYEVGGKDFIVKPFDSDELYHKVVSLLRDKTLREKIQNEKNAMFNTAMTAITSQSEIGTVLNFTRNLFHITNESDLANEITTTLSTLDLNTSVLLIDGDDNRFYSSSSGPLSALEKNFLNHISQMNRIFEKGQRVMFNFDNSFLLIKNAPEDDEKRGRYRDIIAMLMDSVVASMKRIQFDKKIQILLGKIHSEQIREGESILQDLLKDLESSFLAWGLDEEQEKILTQLIYDAMEEFDIHANKSKDIEEQINQLVKKYLK